MSGQKVISIPAMYSEINHSNSNGIAGYQIEKKYFDPLKVIEDRENLKKRKGEKDRRYLIKRGNYLDDEAKIHKQVPGPGKYTTQQEWPTKSKLKIPYPDRKTYFSQIMKQEKRNKKPAPGTYNLTKTQKEVEAEKKRLASKKIKQQDRTSYLDGIQYESSIRPGVGNYNPRDRVKTEGSKLKTKPEEWRKKHEQLARKKPNKSPDPTTYKPHPSFTVFDDLKPSKTKTDKHIMGTVGRFKTEPTGSGLNPGKYSVMQEWRGKEKKEILRHGVEVLSTKTTSKSVYYH